MPLRLLQYYTIDTSSSSEEEDVAELEQRRRKIIRNRINFDFFSEQEFIERFRMSRSAVEKVLCAIGPFIDHRTDKNHALSPKQQILVALHFFGNGSQYHSAIQFNSI